jgi:hypothetical protein
MDTEKTFKTKTGFCHVLPDKIVLTRDGIIGNIAEVTTGNNISRILIIYGLISVALFYLAFEDFQNGQVFQPVIFGLLGIYLLHGIIRSINNSATPVIAREKIREFKFKKGISGLTRSRFEVEFEAENGKMKKRLILLPGSLSNGQDESSRALRILSDEKLINLN